MKFEALLRSAESDGQVWFRATTEAKDRHGTVIETRGIDVQHFLANPVVGWAHRALSGGDPDDVLGRVTSIDRGDGHLDMAVEFADHERAQLTEKLVRGGFINAMSVGIQPKKTATRQIEGGRVPVITESELLEVSIVPVGSNPEAVRLLRQFTEDETVLDSEDDTMTLEEMRKVVGEAIDPITGRLDAIERSLDEPEEGTRPALSGGRTKEDVYDLAGRWLKARAFNDQQTIMEIAGNDPAPEAEVRDMLSAASYLPTQVGTELIRLVEGYSKFMMRSGRVTGTGRTYIMPREAVKMTAGIIAENTSVINSSAQLDTVTMTALNAWSGERVPNRALADSPVSVAGILVRQAGEALATLYDNEFVNGTNVTSGLEDVTTASTTLQDDDIGETTASLYTNQIATQFFDLAEGARANATWVVNETYAKNLSKICGSDDRPIFQFLNDPPAPVFDGAQPGQLFGRPVIVHSAVGADYAYFGDLRRAVMTYMRQGIVAESSRDAEFALDNTLFRFGMRFDIALVEEGQINEHPNA